MNLTSSEFIHKTLFWQRITFVAMSILLSVLWFVLIFNFIDTVILYYQYEGSGVTMNPQFIPFFLCAGVLVAGSVIDFILFQSISALKKYTAANSLSHLEIAFRKQRQFWMGLVLLVLFGGLPMFLLLFLGVA